MVPLLQFSISISGNYYYSGYGENKVSRFAQKLMLDRFITTSKLILSVDVTIH